MAVTLLSYTPEALELLLFSKQTRLTMAPNLMEEIRQWPMERKMKELDYMLGTIESSWEFANFTFLITDVSRAFTHQLVRTRLGSYAQQAQRVVTQEGFKYVRPDSVIHAHGGEAVMSSLDAENDDSPYDLAMFHLNSEYRGLIEDGMVAQDARGVLPTNICTNIMAQFDLRCLSHMARLRLCTRTQGEYQNVFREMRRLVLEVYPWAERFIRVHCAATGVCCFPNYAECPIKPVVYNPETRQAWGGAEVTPATPSEIQALWEHTRFEYQPKAPVP
jgi:flavin-dependent thymidylate synthase